MLTVAGLPIQITKSDLDELFSPYGKIQITEKSIIIKIGDDESIAFVQLDNNEEAAIRKLDGTKWRDKYILHIDPIIGDQVKFSQPGNGDFQETGNEQAIPSSGKGSHSDQRQAEFKA